MIGKNSAKFCVQLNKIFEVLGAPLSVAQDLSKHVLHLFPKVPTKSFVVIKKELGEAQDFAIKKNPRGSWIS